MTEPNAQELRDQAAALLKRSVALDNLQLTKADLKNMTPREISEADAAGRFDALMGISPKSVELREKIDLSDEQISKAEMQSLYKAKQFDTIVSLENAGRFNTFIKGEK